MRQGNQHCGFRQPNPQLPLQGPHDVAGFVALAVSEQLLNDRNLAVARLFALGFRNGSQRLQNVRQQQRLGLGSKAELLLGAPAALGHNPQVPFFVVGLFHGLGGAPKGLHDALGDERFPNPQNHVGVWRRDPVGRQKERRLQVRGVLRNHLQARKRYEVGSGSMKMSIRAQISVGVSNGVSTKYHSSESAVASHLREERRHGGRDLQAARDLLDFVEGIAEQRVWYRLPF